jgi:hypothetical protein
VTADALRAIEVEAVLFAGAKRACGHESRRVRDGDQTKKRVVWRSSLFERKQESSGIRFRNWEGSRARKRCNRRGLRVTGNAGWSCGAATLRRDTGCICEARATMRLSHSERSV